MALECDALKCTRKAIPFVWDTAVMKYAEFQNALNTSSYLFCVIGIIAKIFDVSGEDLRG